MNEIAHVLEKFGICAKAAPHGNGHINRTYLVQSSPRIILQRINTDVFHRPDEVMSNIIGVTTFLRKKIEETIIEFDNHSIHTTVTIGMAIKKSGQTVELWIQEADNKLYTGKNNGRNRVIE